MKMSITYQFAFGLLFCRHLGKNEVKLMGMIGHFYSSLRDLLKYMLMR